MAFDRASGLKKQGTQASRSSLWTDIRPLVSPAQLKAEEQPTQGNLENRAFHRDKVEIQKLESKQQLGTITPAEQQRLGELNSRKAEFWAQRTEQFSCNFAMVPVDASTQHEEMSIQARFASKPKRRSVPLPPSYQVQYQLPELQSISVRDAVIQSKSNQIGPDSAMTAVQHPNHTGLPDTLKSGIESLSGISMDDVKVHYNSFKPAQFNALAYAQGIDIYVLPGQERHLPHEAWHLVQQAQHRVKPTMQLKGGVPGNDDQVMEREADVMGEKALNLGEAAGTRPQYLGHLLQSPTAAKQHVAQLMTYVLPLKEGLWKDENERQANLADARRAGKTPICETAAAVKHQAQYGEDENVRELHIYAHGNQRVIGQYNAEDFHAHLTNDCHVNAGERRTFAIVLHSCMSAAPDPGGQGPTLAQKIYNLNWQAGNQSTERFKGQVVVVGYHSRVLTDIDGNSRILHPAFWDDLDKYEEMFRKVVASAGSRGSVVRRKVENQYLLSAEDSRKVYETEQRQRQGKAAKTNVERRQEQGRPYSFDTGNSQETPKAGPDKDQLRRDLEQEAKRTK